MVPLVYKPTLLTQSVRADPVVYPMCRPIHHDSWPDSRPQELTTRKLSLLTAIVVGRVFLTDRIARLNGLCFKALLSNDLKGFKMLLLWGVAQSGVQAVLAPTLGYMAKTLALDWREVYGNFDIFWDHFPRVSQLHPHPHTYRLLRSTWCLC